MMDKFLALLLTLLVLPALACSLSGEASPTATAAAVETPTLAAATATLPAPVTTAPVSPAATATPPPTATEPPPTTTPPPPATATATTPAGAAGKRIVFDPGATSAIVSGEVGAQESDRYVLRALADQLMSVQVSTPGSATMLLAVYGEDGTLLKRDAVGGPTWSGPLPTTQDYVITVRTAGEVEGAAYTLAVAVSPLPDLSPERISFEPGAVSATRSGTLAAQGDVQQYLFRAGAGQRIEVAVSSDAPGIVIYSLRDDAGQTLAISSDPIPLVAFLPETGDYVITLTTHNIAPAVAYTLTVEITDAGAVPEPERITFAPGATGASVSGTLPSGGSARYILRALSGQTMTLQAAAEPAGAMSILVETEGGRFLTAGTDETPLTLTLPSTQDYRIILTTPLAAPAVTYELLVQIE